MDHPVGYDADIFAWSQQQASVLRRLAHTRRDLPNDLDLDHVAEEIEDVGLSELRTVEKLLRRMLGHAIKLVSAPGSDAVRGWRKEVRTFQADAPTHLTNAMRPRIDLDRAWRLALRDAGDDLAEYGDTMLPLPTTCPRTLDDLLSESFTVDALVDRLATIPRPT
ncbi:DUF29 domain-containing protein [Azospirillum sp. ST 5-10]|uniref:DUF29 domain-containing protein n=1 Tax=unclassified Azospirillum TaxID=2630922 RepID=UPI003F49E7FF